MPKMLHTGQVIIDLVMAVDKLPQIGGDVLAQSAGFEAGGGFNVMAAAVRNGLPVVYLGRHGTGRFGDLARQAMQAEGIHIGISQPAERDTGVCVALTDASAERSFISYIGAEGEVTVDDLNSVAFEAGDYVISAVTACCTRVRRRLCLTGRWHCPPRSAWCSIRARWWNRRIHS